MATHTWDSIEPLEIKNGGLNLELYHEIRDLFSTFKMDFPLKSCCLKFVQLLASSRLLFSRHSAAVFPNKSAVIFRQGHKDGSNALYAFCRLNLNQFSEYFF